MHGKVGGAESAPPKNQTIATMKFKKSSLSIAKFILGILRFFSDSSSSSSSSSSSYPFNKSPYTNSYFCYCFSYLDNDYNPDFYK